MTSIDIQQADLHNLKGISVSFPLNALTVVTGISGSGKSTLVFDVLFESSRRRYLESLGVLVHQPTAEGCRKITGLRPAIAVSQGLIRQSNPRSVVGTRSGILPMLAAVFADSCNRKTNLSAKKPSTAELQPQLLSSHFLFNSPQGMCFSCKGRGQGLALDFSVLLPDEATTLAQLYENCDSRSSFNYLLKKLPKQFDVSLQQPFLQFPQAAQDYVLYGANPAGKPRRGLIDHLETRWRSGKNINAALIQSQCPDCEGYRISREARSVRIAGRHIGELAQLSLGDLEHFLKKVLAACKADSKAICDAGLLRAVCRRIEPLNLVRLDYLSLYRAMPSLSGGEQKRFSLAHLLASEFGSLVYILDEPTTGLHESEKKQLLKTLKKLKKRDSTLIVVEHDESFIRSADHVIDIGPLAGIEGGELVFSGTYSEFRKHKKSLTASFLDRSLKKNRTASAQFQTQKSLADPSAGASGNRAAKNKESSVKLSAKSPAIVLEGVGTHNLNIKSIRFPLAAMTGIAGVSGSGKSSLLGSTLIPALLNSMDKGRVEVDANEKPAEYSSEPAVDSVQQAQTDLTSSAQYSRLSGHTEIDRCIVVTQAAIGRRSNSNPATYLGLWSRIRAHFARSEDSRHANMTAADFSFNSTGACGDCGGNGQRRIWLGGIHMLYRCETCRGRRFRADVLDIRLRDLSIIDVLDLSVADACRFFADDSVIVRMLSTLQACGLGYLTLGQPTSSLSGGEAQRVKLAKELAHPRGRGGSKGSKHVLYVLDEPTNGLSQYDVAKLMDMLVAIRRQGHTIIVIEHDASVLSQCDWLIELGPGSGSKGGKILCAGPPAKLVTLKKSIIGPFLDA